MHIILFEGDYVCERGPDVYSRVIDILDADTVLLANGRTVRADADHVANFMCEWEFAEYTRAVPVPSYSAQREV